MYQHKQHWTWFLNAKRWSENIIIFPFHYEMFEHKMRKCFSLSWPSFSVQDWFVWHYSYFTSVKLHQNPILSQSTDWQHHILFAAKEFISRKSILVAGMAFSVTDSYLCSGLFCKVKNNPFSFFLDYKTWVPRETWRFLFLHWGLRAVPYEYLCINPI